MYVLQEATIFFNHTTLPESAQKSGKTMIVYSILCKYVIQIILFVQVVYTYLLLCALYFIFTSRCICERIFLWAYCVAFNVKYNV